MVTVTAKVIVTVSADEAELQRLAAEQGNYFTLDSLGELFKKEVEHALEVESDWTPFTMHPIEVEITSG